MTDLGLYLAKRTVNKAEVSRRTGISKSRLTQLTSNDSAKLRADELYLIALAINVDPGEIFIELHKGLGLKRKNNGA
ncbi:helix-turn-helix domain-containing protein [Cyclobacterium salsum]|uniref:helix-turn-helix domain-containing protein n=1 Tax=Cyclobacterium salsum TaxID=2666329 RepID=UPI0013909954|nr:helix-turn-helix transcriptional regulator [Cyclobacterium salsum]